MAAPLVSLAALSALAESSSDEDAFDLDADVDAFLAASAERRAGRAPRCTADEQRRRKALTDRVRRTTQRAHVEDGLLVQPPRAVAVLELLDWTKELAPADQCDFPDDEPTTVNSRGDCLRLMSEYGEVQTWDARFVVSGGRNEASGVAPCLTLFETRGVCTQGGCGFTFTWKCGRAAHHRRGRGDDDYDFPDALDHGYRDVDFDETGEAAAKKWTLQTFVRHAFLCGRGAQGATAATDRKRRTESAYTVAQLAVAVASSHTDTQIKFTTQSIKMVLGPLLRVTPSVGLSQRVRIAAIELIQGTPAMNFRLFPALVRELRNAGFGVVLKTCNAAEMNEVIRRKAEADHKLREKGVAAHNKKAFDASALKLPKAKRTEIFLVGWTVTFPTTKKMLCGGGLKPVIAADFATAKGAASASSEKIKGQYGVAAGLDAGSHIVPLAVSWAAGNESTETWLCLVEPVADYYGEVVKSRVAVWVADADKGGAAALKQTFPESGILICSQHRSETAAGKFGKGSKALYLNWVNATTPSAQRVAYNKMTPPMKLWLNKVPPAAQTKLDNAGRLYGKTTSNTAESHNAQVLPMRSCGDPCAALRKAVVDAQAHYERCKAGAENATTYLTAAGIAHIAELESAASRQVLSVTWLPSAPGEPRLSRARVNLATTTARHFDVHLPQCTCTCGLPTVDRDLCVHLVAAALKAGLVVQELEFDERSAARHKAQYAAGGDWPNIAWSAIEPEDPPYLRTLALPNPRGAPKKKRHKGRKDFVAAAARKRMRSEKNRVTTIIDFDADEADDDEDESVASGDADEDDEDDEEEDNEYEEESLDEGDLQEGPYLRETAQRRQTAAAAGFAELPNRVA